MSERVLCCRCGGPTRRGRFAARCLQKRGPCGYRAVNLGGREVFWKTMTTMDGGEHPFLNPAREREMSSPPSAGAMPSAMMGWDLARSVGAGLLEILTPDGGVAEPRIGRATWLEAQT